MNTTPLRRGTSALAAAMLPLGTLLVTSPADAAPAEAPALSPTADSDGDGLSNGDEVTTYSSSPLNPDSDGDGLGDGDEVDGTTNSAKNPNYKNGYYRNHPGSTNATAADTDGDILTDLEEVLGSVNADNPGASAAAELATDPNVADTDGDTLADGSEVYVHSTDPTVADDPATVADPVDTDGDGTTDVTEAAITKTDPDVATVLTADTATAAYVVPGQAADPPTVTTSVLANDTGTLPATTVTAVVDGTGGTWTLDDDSVAFTPSAGFFGPATATYLVTSAMPGQVTVTVANPPAPVAAPDTATTVQGTPVVVDVLANDTISTTSATVTDPAPSTGTAQVVQDKVKYTPPKDFTGTATVRYTVKDAAGGRSTSRLSVVVTPAVQRPATAKGAKAAKDARDTDRDGLTDAQERAGTRYWSRIEGTVHRYRTVTSPYRADTDGDGVSDKVEMDGYRAFVTRPGGKGIFGYARWHVSSDPLRKDTDRDGLGDRAERARRLDARDQNTDGWRHGRPAKDTPQTAAPGVDDRVDRFPHLPTRS